MSRSTRQLGVRHHEEAHTSHRANWLRAGVLGANDGLLSTSSLLIGVASASASRSVVLATGVAALVAGAASMAIGEYSSVSSQRDAEEADLALEQEELHTTPRAELAELTTIYERRGLDRELAHQVAVQLTERDALGAHARDELGLDPEQLVRPVQAAVASALSFSVGALVPLLTILLFPTSLRVGVTVVASLAGLAALGAFGAYLGGAPKLVPALRVAVGGALAMLLTGLVGTLFNANVG